MILYEYTNVYSMYNIIILYVKPCNRATQEMENKIMAEEIIKDEENKDTEQKLSMTQEELDALIQRKSDERVTQALKTQQKKYEKKMSLLTMDEEERAKTESEDRIKELEEQLAQMNIEKARSDLKSTLSARGLDAQFADLLNISDDNEANQKVIAAFDKLWKASVQKEVENRIQGGSPKKGTSTPTEMTKDYFNKMSLAEQADYLKNNPEFKQTMSTWYN